MRFLPLALLALTLACGPHDSDGDGYVDSNPYAKDSDCEPNNPDVHPGAIERCNSIDDNCNGDIDENPTDGETWYRDWDGDRHGNTTNSMIACDQPQGYVSLGGDCNDKNADIWPDPLGHEECNGVDDDCDGLIDNGLENCPAEEDEGEVASAD